MITAEDLINELKEEEQKYFKLATVIELFENETAKIQFDGEDAPSEKQYAYLKSYIPEIDDRILLASVGGTYIILGKVNYDESPNTEEEIDRYLFDLKKVIMQKGLSVTGNTDLKNLSADETAINGNLGVSGDVIAQKISSSGEVSGGSLNISGTASTGELQPSSVNTSGQVKGGSLYTTGSLDAGPSKVSGLTSKNEITGPTVRGTSLTQSSSFPRLNVTASLGHAGTLGLFGKAPQTKLSGNAYDKLNASASLQDVVTKLNNYIDLFIRYGLV